MKSLVCLAVSLLLFMAIPVHAAEPLRYDIEPENNVQIVYVPVSFAEWYKPFQSADEVRAYVKSTDIVKRPFVYGECAKNSLDLWHQAMSDGKPMGLFLEKEYVNGKINLHMKNFAIVGNYIYEVEPLTGNTWMVDGYQSKLFLSASDMPEYLK